MKDKKNKSKIEKANTHKKFKRIDKQKSYPKKEKPFYKEKKSDRFDTKKPIHKKPSTNRIHKTSRKPSLEFMKELFKKCNQNFSDTEYEKLWKFHNMLRKNNDELDLTRIRRFEDYVIKHYVDCTIITTLIKLPSPIVDIGTGAGFPGIPLKIVSPKTYIILGEPRWKRCAFMRNVIEELKLKDVEVYEHKVRGNFPNKVKGVITRAVESILKTLRRSIDFLEVGGQVILMKGPSADPEIEEAKCISEYYKLTKDIKYTIPNTPQKRRLLVYTKIKNKEPLSNKTSTE